MGTNVDSRFNLICAGLYPETLPPCFISKDAKRAFHGLVAKLDQSKFHERKTEYIRYNGTKHDGSRRFFGTPNIISYFHSSSFIWKNWHHFEKNFSLSNYSIGKPEVLINQERSIKVASLSELSKHISSNLRHAPFILKADIAQCFPSLYTHSIAWAAHGIDQSKDDTNKDSSSNYFNALDFFVRNSQHGNTRGVVVGPDAFRLIAEFILSRIDSLLHDLIGDRIIGAVRHVDDYYIGLKSEHDAESVLSALREILATYQLNLNDNKTKLLSSLDPINDLWAQRLRKNLSNLNKSSSHEDIEYAIAEAVETSKHAASSSPIKILLRFFDEAEMYSSIQWEFVEHTLQRIVQKYPHAIDYVSLIMAKRYSIDGEIDAEGWGTVAEAIIAKSINLNHDHEALWMLWLMLELNIKISPSLIDKALSSRNSHIRAFIIQAYSSGYIDKKPKFGLGNSLSTMDSNWLTNLIAKSQEVSKANFSGLYATEFSHLAQRSIKLIDFEHHKEKLKSEQNAISRVRYGYDDIDIVDDDDDDSDTEYSHWLYEDND